MAQQLLDFYGMFDYTTGDSDVYEYTADEFSTLIRGLTGNGVSKQELNEFSATNNGLVVTVDTGICFLDGRFGKNGTTKQFNLTATASGKKRYDIIYIKLDKTSRTIGLDVKQGSEDVNPTEPTLTNTDTVKCLGIWKALIENGSSVTLSDIRQFTYSSTTIQAQLGTLAGKIKDNLNDLNGVLSISKGGTGATTATKARENIGACALEHTHSKIVSGSNALEVTASGAELNGNMLYHSGNIVVSATEPANPVAGTIWLKV